MRDYSEYTEYIVERTKELLGIDSPSGYTREVSGYLMHLYRGLGYEPELTVKGLSLIHISEMCIRDRVNVAERMAAGKPIRRREPLCWRRMWIRWGLWWLRYLQREGCILLLSGE